jgi:hypothetical protein
MRPNIRAARAWHDAGPAIGRDYRGNFNSPLLANSSWSASANPCFWRRHFTASTLSLQ